MGSGETKAQCHGGVRAAASFWAKVMDENHKRVHV